MNYIAHRGLKKNKAKENTIPAFLNAIKDNRYAGFELDIRTTKDNIIIVNHDPFIGPCLIRQHTYQELKDKHQIERLESVLSLKTNKIILIEIKEENLDVKLLNNLLKKYPEKNIYLMSFHNSVMKKLNRLKEKNFKTGILNYILNSEENYPYDFICLLSSIVSEELIKYFKKKKIEVFIYGLFTDNFLDKWKDIYYITDLIL